MAFAGLILLATFVMPTAWDGDDRVTWDLASRARDLWALAFPMAGLVALLCARTRLSAGLRTSSCLAAGLVPLLLVSLFAEGMKPLIAPAHLGWRAPTAEAGLVLCASALLYRRLHDGVAPKLLATLGAGAFLVPLLVPYAGGVPLVEIVSAARQTHGVVRLLPVALLLGSGLSILALTSWRPGFRGAWLVLAVWGLLAVWPLAILSLGLSGGSLEQTRLGLYGAAANVFALCLLISHGLAAIGARSVTV
jgi:hypothetical protein